MNAPSPDLALRDQLQDLADDVQVGHGGLLAGALHRAGRRRRRQVAGTGLVTVVAVAAGIGLAQQPGSGIPAPGDVAPASPGPQNSGPERSDAWKPDPVPLRSLLSLRPTDPPATQPAAAQPPAVVGTVPRASALTFTGRDVFAVDAASGESRKILRLSGLAAAVLPSPNSGSLSPDGTKLAVPSTALGDAARGVTGIWVVDLPTGEGHLYATAKKPIASVSWAPDGTKLWALGWGGGGAWTLDVPAGTVTAVPGVTEPYLFWDGAGRLVTSDGGWRVVDLAGRRVRTLPMLDAYGGGTTWTPAEFAGWSPGGRWLAVQRRDEGKSTFAAVDVSTGRLSRSWGPFPDALNTQNVVGWSGPNTMIVMLRPAGSDSGLRLLELDVATGATRERQTFSQADSAYLPAG